MRYICDNNRQISGRVSRLLFRCCARVSRGLHRSKVKRERETKREKERERVTIMRSGGMRDIVRHQSRTRLTILTNCLGERTRAPSLSSSIVVSSRRSRTQLFFFFFYIRQSHTGLYVLGHKDICLPSETRGSGLTVKSYRSFKSGILPYCCEGLQQPAVLTF